MTREEAIHELQEDKTLYETEVCHAGDGSPDGRLLEALDMAIEALQTDLVRCKDCIHHGMIDCPVWEDVITEDYMWCYHGERREPDECE